MILSIQLAEWGRFLQIVLWISIPAFMLSSLLTVFLHYRKKKKEEAAEYFDPGGVYLIADPSGKEQILFDHSHLIREYRHHLSFTHAKFTAVRKEYTLLREKYNSLISQPENKFQSLKPDSMEHLQDQFTDYSSAPKEWQGKNEETVEAAEPENTTGNYLEEIIKEKKREIEFLQNQLEERIRAGHLAEQQYKKMEEQMQRLYKEKEASLQLTNEDLQFKNQQLEDLRSQLQAREEEIAKQTEELSAKLNQAADAENAVKAQRAQIETLNVSLADKQDLIDSVSSLLENEKEKSARLESKLQQHTETLNRWYRELATAVGEDVEAVSPVIPMSGNRSAEGELMAGAIAGYR